MTCEPWIEALSAQADGEDPGVDRALLEAHLARCASCRAFADRVGGDRPLPSAAIAPATPDLSHRVAKLAASADRAASSLVARILLTITAVAIVVASVPLLVFGQHEHDGHVSHTARHVGAFSIAYAVGLLVVVLRPARARTMLPVAAVVAAALVITALVDIWEGQITVLSEGDHLPELISLPLVWMMARRSEQPRPPQQRSAPQQVDTVSVPSDEARLRVVRQADTGSSDVG